GEYSNDTQVSHFIGREDLLAKIQLAFRSKTKVGPNIVVLYGLSGIGKTQLAKHCANHWVAQDDNVIYI
ncbi:unnamed protein product, partial [Allacma fusca]